AGTKSSATVQQMQPLASSTIFSSGQDSTAQPLRMSPSTPTSPNSLTMSARRLSSTFWRMWRISVVLPAPRNPVTTVQGTRAAEEVMEGPSLVETGDARDKAALEGAGPLSPWDHSVGGSGKKYRAGYQIGSVADREPAENITPAALAKQRGRQAPPAIAQTCYG